jgi:hypothetical protein
MGSMGADETMRGFRYSIGDLMILVVVAAIDAGVISGLLHLGRARRWGLRLSIVYGFILLGLNLLTGLYLVLNAKIKAMPQARQDFWHPTLGLVFVVILVITTWVMMTS